MEQEHVLERILHAIEHNGRTLSRIEGFLHPKSAASRSGLNLAQLEADLQEVTA